MNNKDKNKDLEFIDPVTKEKLIFTEEDYNKWKEFLTLREFSKLQERDLIDKFQKGKL